jgi:hypothetical protein
MCCVQGSASSCASAGSEWQPDAGPVLFQGVDINALGSHLYCTRPPQHDQGQQLASAQSTGVQVQHASAVVCTTAYDHHSGRTC